MEREKEHVINRREQGRSLTDRSCAFSLRNLSNSAPSSLVVQSVCVQNVAGEVEKFLSNVLSLSMNTASINVLRKRHNTYVSLEQTQRHARFQELTVPSEVALLIWLTDASTSRRALDLLVAIIGTRRHEQPAASRHIIMLKSTGSISRSYAPSSSTYSRRIETFPHPCIEWMGRSTQMDIWL
jgi:hypothetical protein